MRWPAYSCCRARLAESKHRSMTDAEPSADERLLHHAGARELQQVVRSGSGQTGQVYGAQATPVTTLNGGNGGGSSGNSGNSGNASAPSSGNGKSFSNNGDKRATLPVFLPPCKEGLAASIAP